MVDKLLPEEKETIIRFDELDPDCSIWTASRKIARRLEKIGLAPTEKDEYGWWFKISKDAVKIKLDKKTIELI